MPPRHEPLKRKNGWHLVEAAGDALPDGMQDFLARTRWDAHTLRDVLRSYVIEHLADPDGVLVLDEAGFLKKGDKSAGVQRQYLGTAGRIENGQVGVLLSYAGARGYAFIDRALYLPADWVADEARCAQAHIPASIGFATKPELARQMLRRAFDAGVPYAWVAGDSVYGSDSGPRAVVAKHGRGYVLGVTSSQQFYWPHHRTEAEITK